MNFAELNIITNLCRLNLEEQFKKLTYYNANTDYVVIWYGAIVKLSNSSTSSKGVEVLVSDLKGSFIRTLIAPLEAIPKMPIGSIWQGGRCTQKLDFEEYYTVLQENIHNKAQTNLIQAHRLEKQDKEFFKDFDNAYGFRLLVDDYNTLIVRQGNANTPTFIIHPLIFFNANYGISKEINRILVTYLWGDTSSPNAKTVTNSLHLNYINPDCPEAVFIPDYLSIGDAVFIHHLRTDEYSKQVVSNLNKRIMDNFVKTAKTAKDKNLTGVRSQGYSFLKVNSYHNQPIEITFEGLPLSGNSNLVLCTRITGISMPVGEPVLFDIEGSVNRKRETGQGENRQRVKPLAYNLDLEEIILSNDSPNNRNTTVIRQKITSIGSVRQTIKNSTIPIGEQVLKGQVTVVDDDLPNQFGTGEKKGTDGNTGSLKTYLEFDILSDIDSFAKDISPYARLLRQAQELRRTDRQFYGMTINCFSLNNGELGEVVKPMKFSKRHTFPTTIFVLKLILNKQTYYVLDCSFNEDNTDQATSGYLIKVSDEKGFLNPKNLLGLKGLIDQIGRNQGRMSEEQYDELKKNQLITRYKHMNSLNSNWLRNAFTGLGVI